MNKTKSELLEGLNEAQRAAVECIEGPSLIVAGAGSGKTRVLTCRIAYLLEQGAKPWEILALTFTKKAAGEMKERVASLVGDDRARRIWMGTFHSVFIRFLKEYSEILGYPRQFTIYDQTESRSVIKQCIKELNLDDKRYKPNSVQSRISLAKNNLRTHTGYRADPAMMAEDRDARLERLCDIYSLYAQKCKTAGAMDFDDILLNTNILLRDNAEALATISGRFRYILVDEYQDTNYAQYLILKKLAEPHRNIAVVGDDSQSIYAFRGARVENILRFQKDYPGASLFRLEQNYRSTQNIVNAANSLIAKNENRIRKECFSKSEVGEKVRVIRAFTEQEEASLIAGSIASRIYSDRAQYGGFAILYRTNAQSRAFEESLRRKNIPYRIYGGHSFFDRTEVRDMVAYFKLIVNPKDDEAFRRVVNVPPRGIGDTTLERLSNAASENSVSLSEAISLPAEKLAEYGLKDAAMHKLGDFMKMISSLAAESATEDAFSLASKIDLAVAYVHYLRNDTTPEGMSRVENVEELFNNIKSYCEEEAERRTQESEDEGFEIGIVTLGDYLENISLLSEVEKDDEQDADPDNRNKVTLMTVHAAKGLEFPYVYIAGMEENLFPSENSAGSLAGIEEERRLFYVALTRAERVVTVSWAQNRMRWGKTESNSVSRFVREIDRRYLEGSLDEGAGAGFASSWGASPSRPVFQRKPEFRPEPHRSQPDPHRSQSPSASPRPAPVFSAPLRHTPSPDFKPDAVSDLREGQRVEHDRFGFGTIMSFDGAGPDLKAVVEFEECGRKTLLLKFAKLKIIR